MDSMDIAANMRNLSRLERVSLLKNAIVTMFTAFLCKHNVNFFLCHLFPLTPGFQSHIMRVAERRQPLGVADT